MGIPKRRPVVTPNERAIMDRVRRARPPKRDETAAIELAKEFGADVPDVLELWHERAAIRTYEGNLPQDLAERFALDDVRDILSRAVSARTAPVDSSE